MIGGDLYARSIQQAGSGNLMVFQRWSAEYRGCKQWGVIYTEHVSRRHKPSFPEITSCVVMKRIPSRVFMTDSAEKCDPSESGRRALIDNFPNGVLVLFDDELRYRIVGPDVLPFSKRKAADMIGQPIDELFPEGTVSRIEPELQATIHGDARSFDFNFDERIHHIETEPVQIADEPYGVLVTQDVSEERELAQELERQNERLDQFASMVSHDLQNPLSIASGRLSLYRETGDDSHLVALERALQRIDELTQDLLGLVRTDEITGSRESVSLAKIARDAWTMIDPLSASLETDDVMIAADGGQLQALFENLFRNAIGHGGADVTVRVGPTENGFYVEDTGEGIPPEERGQVFEHGFSSGYGGNGVGLTIVSRIAQAHDWDVSIAESAEGGARFEFRGVESS